MTAPPAKPKCLMPCCGSTRWADSALCSPHWRKLTLDERRELQVRLRRIACAVYVACEDEQERAMQELEDWLAKIAPQLAGRQDTPTTGRAA